MIKPINRGRNKGFILLFALLTSFDCFSAEFNLLGNALIKRGNTDLTQYGLVSALRVKSFEAKLLSELYSEKFDRFWKHEAYAQYEYEIDKRWGLVSSGMIGQDLKKRIQLQSRELLTVVYKFLPWLKYGLGVGHKHKNGGNDFLVSHNLEMKKEIDLMELHSSSWLYEWRHHYEVDLTLGVRHKLSKRFKLGLLLNYNRSSDYLDGVSPWDLSNKLEIIYTLAGGME